MSKLIVIDKYYYRFLLLSKIAIIVFSFQNKVYLNNYKLNANEIKVRKRFQIKVNIKSIK